MKDVEGVVEEDGVEVLYRYKYLPFNDGSLKVISEGTLKFTCPLEFNDPFDCFPYFDPASIESICEERPDLIKRAAEFKGITYEQMLQGKSELVDFIKHSVDSGRYIEHLMSMTGVLSLSRDPTNILMWSHHANHHRGFLVELRIPMNAPDELLDFILPMEVIYSDARPVVRWGVNDARDIEKYFLVKNIDWSYEEEERVVTRQQGPGGYEYSRQYFLNSVIAGPRIDAVEFERLKRVVEKASGDIGRQVPIFEAKLSNSIYKVYIPGHPNTKFSSEA